MYCNVKRLVKRLYSETVWGCSFSYSFLAFEEEKNSLDHIEKENYLYLTVNKRRDKAV